MDDYDPCPRCGARVPPTAYGPCEACVRAMATRPRFARDLVWNAILRWVGKSLILLAPLLLAATQAWAVPVNETLGLGEALSVQVIHGGPGCSSGWVLVAGTCQAEGTAPIVITAPYLSETLALGESLSITALHDDPPMQHAPEPLTMALMGGTLAAAGYIARRRR